MKKIISLVLMLALACTMVFGLASCGPKLKIGVQSGTTGELYVKGDADMNFPGLKNAACKSYNNAGLAVEAMLNGQLDYVIIDNLPAEQLAASNSAIKVIDIALSTEQYAFGVDKDQDTLKAAINATIATMKSTGALDLLFEKYAAVETDDDGNAIGGVDGITGFAAGTKSTTNPQGQLVVATNAAFAPFEFKIGDKFAGIDIEIMAVVAESLGLELVIADMDFDAVVTSVGKNNVDVAASGLTVKESRKQVVNFTDAYYEGAYQVLIVKADNTEFDACTTAEDVLAILGKK